jgi:hypothetical protein
LQFVNFDSDNNPKIINAAATFDDDWHHLVAVATDSEVKIYMDGKRLTTTGTLAPIVSTSVNVKIGGWGLTGNYYFNGEIDEVRVYNRALTEAEVRYHYNQGKPVGYWKFDEGSGTAAKDSSGNGNDGTISGATWTGGKYGSGLSFDGTGNYVDAGNGSNLNISNAITIEAWIKLAAIPNNPYSTIISKGNGTTTSYWMDIRSGGYILFGGYTSGGKDCYQNTGLKITNANQWYHIVGTYDQMASKVYIDGQLVASVAKTCLLRTNNDNVTIGARLNSHFFNGYLDEVKVYNYARTAEQIMQDYNAGVATHLK